MEFYEILSVIALMVMILVLWPSMKGQLANSRKGESKEWLNIFFLFLGVAGFVMLLVSLV